MSKINVVRVVIGGLAAGVAASAIDWAINKFLMVDEGIEMLQRLNLKPDQVESSTYIWFGVDFVFGLLMVFTYAAMRPRFGPGPKTATIVGMSYWLAAVAIFAGLTAMGVYTQQAFIKNAALSIPMMVIPALLGAKLYAEEGSPEQPSY
jgi:ABC-type Na+ efflux pump permease subunit